MRIVLVSLLLLLPACLSFHDRAGVPVRDDLIDRLQVGSTTRAEVLQLMGPPTGVFDTNLLATVTRMGETFDVPATPGRVDDEVFTWQQIDVRGSITFFPVLFVWGSSTITSRTLSVFFDDDGRVRDVAYREDAP